MGRSSRQYSVRGPGTTSRATGPAAAGEGRQRRAHARRRLRGPDVERPFGRQAGIFEGDAGPDRLLAMLGTLQRMGDGDQRALSGEAAVAAVDVGPFVRALVMLILVPLALAALLQWGAVRGRGGVRDTAAGVVRGFTAAMVPLMVVTLFTVVASQIRGVGERLPALAAVVPLFAAFAAVMVALGVVAARWARLDVPAGRALVFSGATRNSLVVLPLALALPASLDPAPLVVVTQTLVELGAMVSLVRLVPRLLPLHGQSAGAGAGRTVT